MAKREYVSKIAAQTQRLMQEEAVVEENSPIKEEKNIQEDKPVIGMPEPVQENSSITIHINPDVESFIKNKGQGRKKSGKTNRCFYISNSNYEKLKRLGEQNEMSISEVLDSILAEYI